MKKMTKEERIASRRLLTSIGVYVASILQAKRVGGDITDDSVLMIERASSRLVDDFKDVTELAG